MNNKLFLVYNDYPKVMGVDLDNVLAPGMTVASDE